MLVLLVFTSICFDTHCLFLSEMKHFYEKLLKEEFPRDSNLLQMENPKEGPAPWLEKDAIYTALNIMKDGMAAGVSGIVAEMLKASGEVGLELFIELFNNIVKEEKVPSDWEMSVIINCFKGKGDAVERGNFRGLKLLDHSGILRQQARKMTVKITKL